MTDDIEEAIDSVTDEQPGEEPDVDEEGGGSDEESGFLGDALDMSGTGKPLDAYEEHPYRSLASGADSDVDADEIRAKGEKHIARGVDGLLGGIVEAGHPIVDLAIGGFLLMLAGSGGSGGSDGEEYGDEHLDDTPAGDFLTGEDE